MKKKVLFIAAVLVLAAGGIIFFLHGRRSNISSVMTSGIIEGTEVNISPKIAGRIASLCCNEGDPVKAGQVVATLESEDLQASLQQAVAGVARAEADLRAAESSAESARANLRSAEADIATGEADIAQAHSRTEEAQREAERAKTLVSKGFISRESADQLLTAYDTAVATEAAARARQNGLVAKKNAATAQLAASASQINAATAALKEAEANRAFYQSRLDDMSVSSPVSGVVIFKAMEKGENAGVGQTILTLVDLADRYVRADVEETKVGLFSLGSPAKVRVEGLPGKVFNGTVYEIGRYAEFATQRDVIRGRQDIKTFRVKIRIDDDPQGALKPGMTVDVEIRRAS